jgi:hypothetical protein
MESTMGEWLKEYGFWLIVMACVTAGVITIANNNYKLALVQAQVKETIATTKAEEGLKFKFGITKEKAPE